MTKKPSKKATPMQIPVFDLHAQYLTLKPDIDAALADIIATSSYINGPEVTAFEQSFATYCQAKHAVGVSSCSSALDLVLEALDIGEGDEVICPSHTFAATAEAIVHRRAKPVFVDIESTTYCLDPAAVAAALTKKTRAIIVVHLYGQPAALGPLKKLADKHDIFLIEDAAQAHGARYEGQRVGAIGDAGCFSFFPAKNLGCYGDGGAVVTNSAELAQKVSMLKDHGRISKYEHAFVGYGERLDTLQAAILSVKLPHLDGWNTRRREIAGHYTGRLASVCQTPEVAAGRESVFYVYTLRHPKRDKLAQQLKADGIATGVYYPHPLHLQPAFADLGYRSGQLPITEHIAEEILSIPVYPELTDAQVEYIADRVHHHASRL